MFVNIIKILTILISVHEKTTVKIGNEVNDIIKQYINQLNNVKKLSTLSITRKQM